MTSIAPPTSFANVQSAGFGFDYIFAAEMIAIELQDSLDVLGLGVIPLKGDLMSSGSDTLRITDFGGIGWSLPMKALTTETEIVAPSPFDIGFEEITIAPHGLAQSETYQSQILGREPMIMLDALKPRLVQSWLRTLRDKVCITGAGMTTDVGSATTQLSVDDHLDGLTIAV